MRRRKKCYVNMKWRSIWNNFIIVFIDITLHKYIILQDTIIWIFCKVTTKKHTQKRRRTSTRAAFRLSYSIQICNRLLIYTYIGCTYIDKIFSHMFVCRCNHINDIHIHIWTSGQMFYSWNGFFRVNRMARVDLYFITKCIRY